MKALRGLVDRAPCPRGVPRIALRSVLADDDGWLAPGCGQNQPNGRATADADHGRIDGSKNGKADGKAAKRAKESGDEVPAPSKLKSSEYEERMAELQIELVKMQYWVKQQGLKVVLIFEGRDAAGKAARSSGSPSR
jgi:hypothetical protein